MEVSNGLALNGQPVRKKGRPRVTSRDQIVETALDIAASDPAATVSVVAIARRLGIAPMAIYNYFPNKDALMQELSARLLTRMDIRVPRDSTPTETIAIWSHSIRVLFLRHPELLKILSYENGYASAAWLEKSTELFRALELLRYAGDELVMAIRWLWNVVMSAITVEVQESMAPVAIGDDVSSRLGDYALGIVRTMREATVTEGFYERFFDFNIEIAMRSLSSADR
jgi:TetR/AcrR family transcriptional regulator, tetracycline repressor protein